MASRRFASSMTLSAGAKMNSAFLSTNFLISHGQATRSTFTFSRVIHFMVYLLAGIRCFRGWLSAAVRASSPDRNAGCCAGEEKARQTRARPDHGGAGQTEILQENIAAHAHTSRQIERCAELGRRKSDGE